MINEAQNRSQNEGTHLQQTRKVTTIMTTNITPAEMKRKFLIYSDIPLMKYLELYEQVFDIDLYAYRVSFKSQSMNIDKLDDIRDKRVLSDK